MQPENKERYRRSSDSTKWRIYTALALYGPLNGNEIKRALGYENNPTVNGLLTAFRSKGDGCAIKFVDRRASDVGGVMDEFIKRDKKIRQRYVIDLDHAIREVIEFYVSKNNLKYSDRTKGVIKKALLKLWSSNNLLAREISINIGDEGQRQVAAILFEGYKEKKFDDIAFEIIADVVNFRILSYIEGKKTSSPFMPGWLELTDEEFFYLASIATVCGKIPYSTVYLIREVLEKDGTVFHYDDNGNPIINTEEKT
jgi:hypothetical protein